MQQPISDLRWEEPSDLANARSSSMLALPRLIPPTQRVAQPPDAPQKSLLSHPRERLALPQVAPTMATATSSSTTLLKFPTLVKPEHRRIVQPLASITMGAQAACNQEDNEPTHDAGERNNNNDDSDNDNNDATQPTLRPSRAVGDKNRDFIKELEEKKRREKEDQARRAARKQKLQKKLSRKILQEAANARQRQQSEPEEPEMDSEQRETTDRQSGEENSDADDRDAAAQATRRKEKAKKQKRLLAKQQALLEQIQIKQREKSEEVERERERERRKQARVKKSMLDAIYEANGRWSDKLEDEITGSASVIEDTSLDPEPSLEPSESEPASTVAEEEDLLDLQVPVTSAAVGSAMALLRERREGIQGESVAEKPKPQRNREQRDAVHRKQQEYLLKLSEQRKQKQRDDEDARALQEKKKKKAQQEAFVRLQEAAVRQQQLQKTKDEEEAAATAARLNAAAAAPPVDVEAMVARLSKLKDRDKEVIPEARDFASWRKRHGVPLDQKVFCMTGWYPVIRAELEARGWFYNPEKNSPFFDLKWSLKSDDLKGCKLEKHQYVNHFFQNTAITTKVGLLHNLRNLVWHQSLDVDTLFPRAYDLNEPRDMEMFVQDFRYGVAEGLLKEMAKRVLQKSPEVASQRLNAGVVAVLVNIGRKKLKSIRQFTQGDNDDGLRDALEESVDNLSNSGAEELVTDLEWEVLTRCPLNKVGLLRASLQYKKKIFADERTDTLLDGINGSVVVDTVLTALEKKQQRAVEKQRMDTFNREKARISELVARVAPLSPDTLQQLTDLVLTLEKTCPQFHLNGGGDLYGVANLPSAIPSASKNVWIVKPAGMSRGRGIRVFNDLERLLEYADVENHKECQWVAQKYIENPLLVCKRKFDIRQWVLVTSWDPLTVWFYEDCYLRFSSQEYSMDDLSDQYVHLTNNSIQKYSDTFHEVYGTDDGGMQVEGNMWHSDDFKHYIKITLQQPDAWDTRVHPRMKEIVVASLQCVQDMVQHRKNCCELYGYDFMVDHSLTPWLIEVNSSPACDYSTPTAKRYVETGLAGIIKVIVDHREYERKKKHGQAPPEGEPSTGCWQMIHKAEYIGQPVSSFGADFHVRGAKVQKSRRAARNTMTAASAPALAEASIPSSNAAPPWTGSEDAGEEQEDEAATEDQDREKEDRESAGDDVGDDDDADSLL